MSFRADLFVEALDEAGVDNWEGHSISLDGLSRADRHDDDAIYNALMAGGVDNWSGYDYAQQIYNDLLEKELAREESKINVDEV